jgi:gliding motility-associated-like protein
MLYSIRYCTIAIILVFTGFAAKALTVDFTASQISGCSPMAVSFTNLTSGASSYDWDFGDGSSHVTTYNAAHSYTTGTYTVVLTAYTSSGSSTKSITLHVYDTPSVYFRADTAVCVCNIVHFYDSTNLKVTGTAKYLWNFGNGDTSADQNPTYIYCTAGTYTTAHTVWNSAGCKSGLSKPYYIHVYKHPDSVDFSSANATICGLSGTVSFTSHIVGGTSPYTYDWDWGDGSSHGTGSNPSHSYTSSTYRTFTVTLIVTSRVGCKDTVIKNDFVTLTHVSASFTLSSSTICQNDYVTVANTSTPAFTSTLYKWGDMTSSNTDPTYHGYSAAGTYTITLVTQNGDCEDSTTKSVIVNPVPIVKFGATPLKPCPAPATITFTDSTTGVSTRTWVFGDGSSRGSGASPTHTYTSNGFYDVTLICTNSYGCTDSLTLPSYISIYPIVGINILGNGEQKTVGGCLPFSVSFSASVSSGAYYYPYGISTYSWDFGDGSSLVSSATPTHSYTSFGTYKVKLHVTTTNGCSAYDSFTVKVGTPPIAGFTASPTTGCVHQQIKFTNTTDTATDYSWDFGDGSASSDTSPVHQYYDTGHFTVTLIALNNGCPDTFTRHNYITINLPVANFVYTYACDTPNRIRFWDSSKGASTYDWDFGDGSTHATTRFVSHLYASTGAYRVTLVVTNSATGCKDTFRIDGLAVYNFTMNITASQTMTCLNVADTFTGTVTGIPVTEWAWEYDRRAYFSDTLSSMPYAFSTTGYHTVKLYVVDARNCLDTFSRINYVGVAQPTVSFSTSPTNGCVPLTTYFTNNSTDISGVSIASSTWDYGDGSTRGTGASSSHTYNAVGSFNVTLITKDNVGCTDSLTKFGNVTTHKPTAAFFGTPVVACKGSYVTFVNTSSGLPVTAFWRFGDGDTVTSPMPSHKYKATGTYKVTLIDKDTLGCIDSLVKPAYITVLNGPSASFTMSDTFSICAPLNVNFTNTSTGPPGSTLQYYWDFGDPTATASLAKSPSWSYFNPGYWRVTMVVTSNPGGCTDTAYGYVRLLGYKGSFDYSPTKGCAPLTVNFESKVSGIPDYIYDYDDGSTLKTKSSTSTHVYTTPGPHVPKLIMTDDSGCSSESIGLDTIFIDGVYSGYVIRPEPTCDSGTIELLDTATGSYSAVIKHEWIFHDGTIRYGRDQYFTYHGPGVYSVTLIDSTATGCVDTLNSSVTFWPLPTINAGPDTTICLNDHALLHPTGGVSYVWSPPSSLSCDSCANPLATPNTATSYIVRGKDIHGCTNVDTIEVFIKTKTTSIAHGSGEICQGESLRIGDSAGYNAVYTWVPSYGLNDPHIDTPLANPDTSVLYMAVAQQGSCIADTQYVNVIVHPRPVIDLGPDQTIIAGSTVQLNIVGAHLDTLVWKPGESLSCDSCLSPIASPKKTTKYFVVVHTDFNCYDSSSVTINVICDHSQVYMPNTFTPNGDGQNDVFYPRGKGLQIIKSFKIFDRWGQKVFERDNFNTNEKDHGWDGTFKGAPLSPDVYVYLIDAICDTGEPLSWKGDISLIR